MSVAANFVLGLLFGIGLIVAGMADPAKVLAFLDPLGAWDPSLGLVMAAAVTVAFAGYRLAFARGRPLLAPTFQLPTTARLDRRLLAGAALFGIGWGIGGFCPGPALVSLGLAQPGTLVFVPAMLFGIWVAHRIPGPRQP